MAPALDLPDPIEESAITNPLKEKPKLVAPEPEHCPGPESEQAGQADSCAGCPNQEICASAPKGPDPDIPLITERLENVKHKILVLSGKGGVGKASQSLDAPLSRRFTNFLSRAHSQRCWRAHLRPTQTAMWASWTRTSADQASPR